MRKTYTAATRGCRLLPSYYEAIRPLPAKARLQLYDSLMDYVFQRQEPDSSMSPTALAVFNVMRPNLDNSVNHLQKQYENGIKGGRPPITQE